MVAYSFKGFFAPQIVAGIKTQTIRNNRLRHARPDEAIQLYVGMRTRFCRKIRPDVRCQAIEAINIAIHDDGIGNIVVGDRWLSDDEKEVLARADGFAPNHINNLCLDMIGDTEIENMGLFWRENYGPGLFSGVLIRWVAE